MSLTEAEHVFAGLHEDGLNDLLTAFFRARPRHLNYGSSMFVSSTTATHTNIQPIPFPGIPGGIHWAVSFRIPRADFFEQTSAGPPEISLSSGQFSLRTVATLQLNCGHREREPDKDRDKDRDKGRDKDREERQEDMRGWSFTPTKTELEIWAVGHPLVRTFGSGTGEIGLAIDQVEIVDVSPDTVESLLECFVRMLLQGALSNVWLPFEAVRAGAFSLTLLRGPEVEDDQAKLYGQT